jgi:mannose-6-phosphate isomerase
VTEERSTAALDQATAPRRVDKPWGHELIWVLTDRYCGKVITIDAGRRLSLQRHRIKDEAVLILSGRLRLHLEDESGVVRPIDLGPGGTRRIAAGRKHRFEALERTELVEISTPELDDLERLEDDYGREGTSAP